MSGASAHDMLPQLEQELSQSKRLSSVLRAMHLSLSSLLFAAAVAVIVAMLVFPVLKVSGTSMTDTLQDGDVVIVLRKVPYKTGDIVAFSYNNNILIKRVIATPGQWVDVEEDGTVSVDHVRLEEPYLTDKAFGDCDIELPYQVPEGKIFVMGDHRSTSFDSRNTAFGCVPRDHVVGKILLRLWPFSEFGPLV